MGRIMNFQVGNGGHKMKKFYYNIFLVLTFVTMMLIGISIWGVIDIQWRQNKSYLGSLIENVNTILSSHQNDFENSKNILIQDYYNRGDAIRFMIKENQSKVSDAYLKEIRDVMGIAEIYILDQNAQIQYGTDENTNIIEENAEFIQNFIYNSENGYSWQLNKASNEKTLLSLLKLDTSKNINLLIESNLSDSAVIKKEDSFKNKIRDIPTDYNTIILCIDAKTGKIIGISENNTQVIEFAGIKSNHELRDRIKSLKEKDINLIKINGEYSTVAMQKYNDDYILLGIRLGGYLYSDMLHSILGISSIILLSYFILLLSVRYLIKKIFLKDINRIGKKIPKVLHGDFSIDFEKCQSEELDYLVSAIQELKEGYIHKTERMNSIFNAISPNIAVFELLNGAKANFFSNNFKEVLGLLDEDMEYFQEDTSVFIRFIKELYQQTNQRGIAQFKDRFLEVHIFSVQDELVGVLIDRTNEELESTILKKHLENAIEENKIDDLTGLMNRKGFKETVENYLNQEDDADGVLLVFDLDNFKSINDNLGHPEGDKALKLFAEFLRKEFRKDGVIARIGGDEFMVFLSSSMNKHVLINKLDQLLVNAREVLKQYSNLHVSLSIGVSKIDKTKRINDIETLYESGDTALYIAKSLGKNQYYINN